MSTITSADYGKSFGASTGQFLIAHDGNLYCCLIDNTNHAPTNPFHMYKSTDQGTTWSDVGTGPGTHSATGFIPSYTLDVDGDIVQVLWATAASGPTVNGAKSATFDLSTDTWSGASTVTFSTLAKAQASQSKALLHLVVRGPSDYVVLYSSPPSGSNGRVAYAPYDGTTVGTGVLLPSQGSANYLLLGGVYDPISDVTLFAYREGADNSLTGKLWVVGLSGTSFGTPVQISSGDFSWWTASQPIKYTSGGVAYFGIATTQWTSPNEIVKWYTAPFALNPTFAAAETVFTGNGASNQNVPLTSSGLPDGSGDARALTVGCDGVHILVVWTSWLYDNDDQEYVYNGSSSDLGSGIWSSVSALFQPLIGDSHHEASQVHAAGVPGGIGVIGISFSNYFVDNGALDPQFYFLVGALAEELRNTFE